MRTLIVFALVFVILTQATTIGIFSALIVPLHKEGSEYLSLINLAFNSKLVTSTQWFKIFAYKVKLSKADVHEITKRYNALVKCYNLSDDRRKILIYIVPKPFKILAIPVTLLGLQISDSVIVAKFVPFYYVSMPALEHELAHVFNKLARNHWDLNSPENRRCIPYYGR